MRAGNHAFSCRLSALKWPASSEKVPSNIRKLCIFRSSCACATYHPGLCSSFMHSVVSNDSFSGQWRPWSDCTSAQSDQGLQYPHMPEDTFSPCTAYVILNDLTAIDTKAYKLWRILHFILIKIVIQCNASKIKISQLLPINWLFRYQFKTLGDINGIVALHALSSFIYLTCRKHTPNLKLEQVLHHSADYFFIFFGITESIRVTLKNECPSYIGDVCSFANYTAVYEKT